MLVRKLFGLAWHAYVQNIRLISFFSVPFLVSFPLALLLPNYIALSGIFLRIRSLGTDVQVPELALLLGVALGSLLLFSFALAAVNTVVRAQRTMVRLKHVDFERIEEATFRTFGVLLLAFGSIFAFALLVSQATFLSESMQLFLRALFTLIVSVAVLFAPQAIVIDQAKSDNALALSLSMLSRKPVLVGAYLVFALALLALNAWVFIQLEPVVFFAPMLGLVTNALVITPFLEVLKVQIYLSKYSLL